MNPNCGRSIVPMIIPMASQLRATLNRRRKRVAIWPKITATGAEKRGFPKAACLFSPTKCYANLTWSPR